jgi:hypothetical protein
MNTYWMLFKIQRRSLLICGAVCFLAMLLLTYADAEPSKLDKAIPIQTFSLMLPLLLASLAGFHTSLFKLPFPMTHRQLAWVPTLCLACLWAASLAGVFTGVCILNLLEGPAYALPRWMPFLIALIKTVPLAFLAFATIDRFMRYSLYFGFFYLYCFPLLATGDRLEGLEPTMAFYAFGWPLCIVFGVFFILEGPVHIASLDYPVEMQQGLFKNTIRTPGGPFKTPTRKILADQLSALLFLPVALLFLFRFFPIWNLEAMGLFATLSLVVAVVFIGFFIRSAWRNTQANGFDSDKTIVIFLMKCSLVFLPMTWAQGAKRGPIATCAQCKEYKFICANHCPHCGHANHGDFVHDFALLPTKSGKKKPIKKRQVSARWAYRIMLPMYLIMFGIIGDSTGFQTESVSLHRKQSGAVTAFEALKEALDGVEDARAWLNAGEQGAVVFPERFRIEVLENPGTAHLDVKFYCLRWDQANEIGERLKTRLLESAASASFEAGERVLKNPYKRIRLNRALLPTFLDQGIHWVPK